MSEIITIDRIPAIIEQLHTACGQIVAETARQIADVYRETAAKDTGFMRSSAYTRTHDASSYAQALDGKGGPLLPEVEKPGDDQTAIAAVAAAYAGYVEFGTRRMGAQPAFYPAADKAQQFFSQEMSDLEKRVKG